MFKPLNIYQIIQILVRNWSSPPDILNGFYFRSRFYFILVTQPVAHPDFGSGGSLGIRLKSCGIGGHHPSANDLVYFLKNSFTGISCSSIRFLNISYSGSVYQLAFWTSKIFTRVPCCMVMLNNFSCNSHLRAGG